MSHYSTGTVHLVGAGPGDPDLLTLKAWKLIQAADVIVYDRLVSSLILDCIPPTTKKIAAGKERGKHTMPQSGINQLLVELVTTGYRQVVRLKGGDPFTFGRGGEEIATLCEQGIPFSVTPGITAATGVAAYAGIPLTHRDYAHSCLLVTGHLKDNTIDLDWSALVRKNQTIVVYMGLQGLSLLCANLIRHGLPPDWPASIIQHGTRATQKTVVGTLSSLPEKARQACLSAPTLIIIGKVVRLHSRLQWVCDND